MLMNDKAQSQYQIAKNKFHSFNKNISNRFQPYHSREQRSDIPLEIVKSFCKGKYLSSWCGANLLKDPLSLQVYSQMLQDIPFRTIFEFGSYEGAFAKWMADHMTALDRNSFHIYSYDKEPILLDSRFISIPDVSFIEMDVNNIRTQLTTSFLKTCPKPWLLIEDCHENVLEILQFFNQYMTVGDYIVIEDTNPLSPHLLQNGSSLSQQPYKQAGSTKLDLVTQFITECKESYLVDSYYCDFFGYNSTFQWNSILKRC